MSRKYWSDTPISGTYTPTVTNQVNITALTVYAINYIIVGDMVTISGRFDIDITTASTSTSFEVSLVRSANFLSTSDGGGIASGVNAGDVMSITPQVTTDTLLFKGVPTTAANTGYQFTATYREP